MTRTQTLLACLASIFCLMATASAQALPSWNDTPTKAAIMSFVEKVTQEGSPDFVRPEDRVAVFDNDGTLWSEQPMYTQLAFIIDRIKAMAQDHPEWKDKEPFKSLLAGDMKGVAASGEKGLLALVAATHAGMTTEAFETTVIDWLKTAKHPKFNRSYLECVYQPQVELLQYLRDHGFKTSGYNGFC